MRIQTDFPSEVKEALQRLEASGFQAYVVGGAVRDILMGITPRDYDLATSATPSQIQEVFKDYRMVTAGIKHGTVSPIINYKLVEITSFRSDGSYQDHRHPDRVRFGSSLEEDSSRRDYTINSIYCDIEGELHDPQNGIEDIKNRLVRAVGNPEERFREDALRIPRGILLAAKLDFDIDINTSDAMRSEAPLIEFISRERCTETLLRLLQLESSFRYIRLYPEVFSYLLPSYLHESWVRLPDQASKSVNSNLAALFLGYSEKDDSLEDQLLAIKLSRVQITLTKNLLEIPEHYTIFSLNDKLLFRRFLLETDEIDPSTAVLFLSLRDAFNGNISSDPAPALQALETDPLLQNVPTDIKDLKIDGNTLLNLGFPRSKVIASTLKELLLEINQMRVDNSEEVQVDWAKEKLKSLEE